MKARRPLASKSAAVRASFRSYSETSPASGSALQKSRLRRWLPCLGKRLGVWLVLWPGTIARSLNGMPAQLKCCPDIGARRRPAKFATNRKNVEDAKAPPPRLKHMTRCWLGSSCIFFPEQLQGAEASATSSILSAYTQLFGSGHCH